MSTTRTIGKDTIGDSGKMKTTMRTYNRSTHDLGYIWRNTQAVGTLVPFMSELALRGDTHEIRIQANVMTHPTVGPLFGSFKLQMDVFSCPIRLYNGWLHNNKLNVGLDIKQIKLPQIERLITNTENPTEDNEFKQINPSCLLAYLGLRGWGVNAVPASPATAHRNGVPLLAYWDVVKNYYANRQEKNAYYIGTNNSITQVKLYNATGPVLENTYNQTTNVYIPISAGHYIEVYPIQTNVIKVNVKMYNTNTWLYNKPLTDYATKTTGATFEKWTFNGDVDGYIAAMTGDGEIVKLNAFPLKNIDDMREKIMYWNNASYFAIKSTEIAPYGNLMATDSAGYSYSRNKQFGLALKTYNSDIMQNWINTEWIDGTNGINKITAVSTASGSFTMDSLNLAKKVYDMLNRIAVSGGTYKDWLETVYTDGFTQDLETPTFEGGASQEIVFQEVVSQAATSDEPLGSLAGRGKLGGDQKGGTIKIKTQEPSYILGICSITPRIDYNQGNRFDTLLETLDDLHKPALDGIGFQNLITDKMAWWDTKLTGTSKTFRTVGKQPAWLDYMTNYNQVFGNFASTIDEGFMILNRNYGGKAAGVISDLTTYIDPSKFNYIFADTRLDAMNFWVQMKVDMKVRRLISAKEIPNL